jgi:hypothetical protein
MSHGRSSGVITTLTVLAVCFAACCGLFNLFCPYTVQSLDAGNGLRIAIVVEPSTRRIGHFSVLYEIWRNDQCIVPACHFGDPTLPKDKSFELLSVEEGCLVAVYKKKQPHLLHLMYDTQSGELWPHGDGKGGYEARRMNETGERLVRRIREWTNDARYQFDYYPGMEEKWGNLE